MKLQYFESDSGQFETNSYYTVLTIPFSPHHPAYNINFSLPSSSHLLHPTISQHHPHLSIPNTPSRSIPFTPTPQHYSQYNVQTTPNTILTLPLPHQSQHFIPTIILLHHQHHTIPAIFFKILIRLLNPVIHSIQHNENEKNI